MTGATAAQPRRHPAGRGARRAPVGRQRRSARDRVAAAVSWSASATYRGDLDLAAIVQCLSRPARDRPLQPVRRDETKHPRRRIRLGRLYPKE